MAPPVRGMCSSPVICGRHSRCRNGPATTLETWYYTRFLHQSGPVPLTITGVQGIPAGSNGRITASCGAAAGYVQMFWLAVRGAKLEAGCGFVPGPA